VAHEGVVAKRVLQTCLMAKKHLESNALTIWKRTYMNNSG
jgi:hypothetical protein